MAKKIERKTLENDPALAATVKCPTHGIPCRYWPRYDEAGYHAIAICRKCNWRKEF